MFCRSKEKPNPLKVISKHEILVYYDLSFDVRITSWRNYMEQMGCFKSHKDHELPSHIKETSQIWRSRLALLRPHHDV